VALKDQQGIKRALVVEVALTALRYSILFPILAIVAPLAITPAAAQSQCGPRQEVVKSLGDRFKEAPVGMGMTQPGQVLELFASKTGSWTMVITNADGRSCLLAAGENWDMIQAARGTPISY
jgi:hypothetical protein